MRNSYIFLQRKNPANNVFTMVAGFILFLNCQKQDYSTADIADSRRIFAENRQKFTGLFETVFGIHQETCRSLL